MTGAEVMYDEIKKIAKKVKRKILGKKFQEKNEILSIEKSGRSRSTVFARKLLEYDVVSFDIFDTLILRTLNRPTDIFMMVGQKLGVLNYTTMRKDMELMLRDKQEAENGSREVTFAQIYQAMEKYCGVDAELGMKTEFETELDFCIANPYMKEVFDLLISYGKKVIIVSDMYFPEEMMKRLLASCGYEGYDRLFVSCDYGYSKRSGKLYQIVEREYLKGQTVVHVGDNETVDLNMAKEQGWAVQFYPSIASRGAKYRPGLMSPCIGSAYQAVVNIKMHSGAFDSKEEKELPYQYGYTCGGILILGYVTWIHEQAVKEHMDKILFIARDGWIMKKVYDQLYDDIPSKYVYLSRNAALKLSYDKNRFELLKQFIDRRIEAENPFTVKEILLSMELECLIPFLSEISMDKNHIIDTKEAAGIIKEFVLDHWNEVSDVYESSLEAFSEYIRPILSHCHHVAAVDTGWRGTCPMALKFLIEEKLKENCKVTGMMMGSCKYKLNNTIPLIADKSIRVYLFSPEHNDHLARFHYKNNLIHNTCVEFITSAPHPSVYSFEKGENGGYKIKFEHPEVENYKITEMIHQGTMDFVKDYKKYYKSMKIFWKIPALDAYWPLRFAMEKRFHTFICKAFQKYVYNKYVGGLEGKRDMGTFEEMCQEEGV